MKRQQIRKIVEDKMEEISTAAGDVGAGFDKDDIHRFRVAIKGLRSFLRLYWMHTGDTKPAISRKFIKLYHTAGDIRDLQLELEKHTKSKKMPDDYLYSILKEIEEKKEKWCGYDTGKILRKSAKRFTGYEYEALPVFAFNSFVNSRVGFIDQGRQKESLSDEEIHSVRKLIKDIIYNTKLAKKNWKEAYKSVHNLPSKKFDELATGIGDLNDDRLMLEHMENYDPKALKPDELRSIKSVRDNMKATIRKQKKSVMAELGKLDVGMVY